MLTDQEIVAIMRDGNNCNHNDESEHIQFARAVLAAAQAKPEVANSGSVDPVLVVEREPDYWSGGHFHQGTKPRINPVKVLALPIGTRLYAHPPIDRAAPSAEGGA